MTSQLLVTTLTSEILPTASVDARRAALRQDGWTVTDRADRSDGTTRLQATRQEAVDMTGINLARELADDAGSYASLIHTTLDAAARGPLSRAQSRKLLRVADDHRNTSGPVYRALQAAVNAVQSVSLATAEGRAGALACVRNAFTAARRPLFEVGARVETRYKGIFLHQPWLNHDARVGTVERISPEGYLVIRWEHAPTSYYSPADVRATTDPAELPFRWITERDHGDAATLDDAARAGRAALNDTAWAWMVVIHRANPREYLVQATRDPDLLRQGWSSVEAVS